MNTKPAISLEKLAAIHHSLVNKLREVLNLGQASFIKAGEYLHKIKENKTYKCEDSSLDITWEEFCQRPDLPIPSKTPEGKRRVADNLIRVYKVFTKQWGFPDGDLGPIGWTKLGIISSVCEDAKDKDIVDDWVEKARQLTCNDLQKELGSVGKVDPTDCKHANSGPITIYKCPDCGLTSKNSLI
jgi:hypothetical protein